MNTETDLYKLSCGCVVEAGPEDRVGRQTWHRMCPYAARILRDGVYLDKLNDHFALKQQRPVEVSA